MTRRFWLVMWLISGLMILGVEPARAIVFPLPPLPPQAVRDSVLAQTNGAQFTYMGTPTTVRTQLASFSGVFEGIETKFAWGQAVQYINMNGDMLEILIPMKNAGSIVLDPDMTAPGLNPRPGKIIGASYQPARGSRADMIIVAVFRPQDVNCRRCAPEKVRFYYNNTRYYEYDVRHGRFVDVNHDRVLEKIDAGALISEEVSCVSVGLEQLCWEPDTNFLLREDLVSNTLMLTAYTYLNLIYDVDVDFYLGNTVPDLLGRSLRQSCALQVPNLISFISISACVPSVMFTSSRTLVPGQPIGIIVVTTAIDVRTFNATGQSVGMLPAGSYLVMDAMPNITTPGAPTLLFLVNSDLTHHYLIPATVQQGFAQNVVEDPRVPGVRDGLMAWRGVGY